MTMAAPAIVGSPTVDEDPIDVSLATAQDSTDWERYVASHPEATGYHSWHWQTVFKSAFGHDAYYLIARVEQRIVGVLPMILVTSPIFGRSLTSMAFLNYGGVVADSSQASLRLLEEARKTATRLDCPHVELRHIDRRFNDLPCRQHKVTMLLPLQSGMWEALDRKVRNQVRKAQKSGLTVKSGHIELLDAFYGVFARNMRDLGTPVYSRGLFENVLAAFPHRASLHVVKQGTVAIAGGLTFATGGRIEVPWASSVRDFNSLCPNHLLYWDIIERAIERKATTMDFGRSTPNEGTFKFKEQWGAQPVALHWEYLMAAGGEPPQIAAGNPKFRLMVEAWKRLPLGLATALGPKIVKGIP